MFDILINTSVFKLTSFAKKAGTGNWKGIERYLMRRIQFQLSFCWMLQWLTFALMASEKLSFDVLIIEIIYQSINPQAAAALNQVSEIPSMNRFDPLLEWVAGSPPVLPPGRDISLADRRRPRQSPSPAPAWGWPWSCWSRGPTLR